jgi:peptidoglycan/xylan/chitin deacetylase (PgdA/CDA1 family)
MPQFHTPRAASGVQATRARPDPSRAERRTAHLTRPELAVLDADRLLSLQASIGNQAVSLLIQRAATDAGLKTDAGTADAGAAPPVAGLVRAGGDEGSKKIVYISWTFDDGPSSVTEDMEKKAPVPGTWFIMRDRIGAGDLAKLKTKQDGGQEFGIHGVHPTKNHVEWFPGPGDGHYGDIRTAITDLEAFLADVRKAGIAIRFVRVPGGLESEIQNYLAFLGVEAARAGPVAKAIVKGLPIPKDPKASAGAGADAGVKQDDSVAINKVKADYLFMQQKLGSLRVQEVDWEAESEPLEVAADPAKNKKGLTNDVIKRFNKVVDATAKDGGPHSLIILAHDTLIASETGKGGKRSQKVAQDMPAMEGYAKAQGVRVEYYTMSDLMAKQANNKP